MPEKVRVSLIKCQSCHPIETIFRAIQLSGFYKMATLAFNELSKNNN